MEDSTTFDFVEDSKAGMEFLCRLMEREVNALLLTDFAEFVANPEKDGQAVIVRNGFYAVSVNIKMYNFANQNMYTSSSVTYAIS